MNVPFDSFISQLTEQLKQPLPGKEAHLPMIAPARLATYERGYNLEEARHSSVLLLLYPSAASVLIPFIQRPVYDGTHSGQISLPGGKMEPEDRSPEETALREANEEIGIYPADVKLIGKLSQVYIPPSKFLVNVMIGYQLQAPQLKRDEKEVDEIIQVSIDDLLKETNVTSIAVTNSQGLQFDAPCFFLENKVIWGATAMMLNEFKWILREMMNN
ncbi:NUDIX hydrolase [Solitalea lacus]|uniref:NUDIX hydrolase n=1 Tax=Solitalea lacus TaxID=2911172 RepID=UPI001EDB3EC0|nr:CoA pyrophosphatase [Solitalea lacus]UKJ08799.1 CoA pyrophosphatase [Solitalea lacus]